MSSHLYKQAVMRRVILTLSVLLLGLVQSTALAQVCLHTPNKTPDFSGMPQWPTPATVGFPYGTDGLPPLPPAKQLRLSAQLGDPRWANAPFRELPSNTAVGTGSSSSRYRILVNSTENPTQLAVSMQIRATNSAPTASDFAYFGISTDPPRVDPGTPVPVDQFRAWGLRVEMASPPSGVQYQPITAAAVNTYTWDSAAWSATSSGIPPWIVPNTLALWYYDDAGEAAHNGASFGLQFKVDLAFLGLDSSPSEDPKPARMFLGNEFSLTDQLTVSTANTRVSTVCPEFATDPDTCFGTTANGAFPNPFLRDMNWWPAVEPIGMACTGINLLSSDIVASHVLGGGTTAACINNRNNCLSAHSGALNTFETSPTVPESLDHTLGSDEVVTTFKMSNWGTVAKPSQWRELGSVGNEGEDPITFEVYADANDLEAHPMTLACPANSGDGFVCALPTTTTNPLNDDFHQCLQAELSRGSNPQGDITFANASAYINTRFENASLIDTLAELNLRDVPDLDPSNPNYEIYLHVVETNLPAPGKLISEEDSNDYADGLEAIRRQTDRSYSARTGGCSQALDRCTELDGPTFLRCASSCSGEEGLSCPDGDTAYPIFNGPCYCLEEDPAEWEICTNATEPAEGGYDTSVTALEPDQVQIDTYPTLMVYPYYDSEEDVVVDGETKSRVIGMPSFGVHALHRGEYYGWLTDIVDESGGQIEKIEDDIYKVYVPKSTGIARIRVLISAEEKEHLAPLTEVAGSATVLPFGLGNVFLTGVTNTSTNIDLSQSSITLNSLLSESGIERVRNLDGPVTLNRLPGATATYATFASSDFWGPDITVTIAHLPLIGEVVQINVVRANVKRPSSCGWFFGRADLSTEFTLTDTASGAEVTVSGTDEWTCVPFELLNY